MQEPIIFFFFQKKKPGEVLTKPGRGNKRPFGRRISSLIYIFLVIESLVGISDKPCSISCIYFYLFTV